MPQSKYFGKYRYLGAQLYLLGIVGPRPKLHITVLLIKGKPGSQEMKKVRGRLLTKLSREKLVERRAWKLSELKKREREYFHIFEQEYITIFSNILAGTIQIFQLEYNIIFANILAGTIQRRFGRRTCRWRVGSMSPRLRVQLINWHLPNHLLFPI